MDIISKSPACSRNDLSDYDEDLSSFSGSDSDDSSYSIDSYPDDDNDTLFDTDDIGDTSTQLPAAKIPWWFGQEEEGSYHLPQLLLTV